MILGIQYLRGLAAIMVAAQHARFNVPGAEHYPSFGLAGVDIFFVISGYVMALTTSHLQPQTLIESWHAFAEFIKRRLLRIVPLYWIALWWTARRDLPSGQAGYLWQDMFFIPRLNAADWGAITPVLNQGWTLNFEMLFYLIVGLSLLFRSHRHIFVALVIGSIAAVGALTTAPPKIDVNTALPSVMAAFYFNDIILEFLFGMAVFKATPYLTRLPIPTWAHALIALASFGALWLANGTTEARCLTLGVPSAVLVASTIQCCRTVKSRWLETLGDASYAIYLFHWASYGALKPVFSIFEPDPGNALMVAVMFILHLLMGILSGIAIHLLVEKPLNGWVRKAFDRKARAG
jgi:exopolysaccharide production protein ExoZ